MAVGSKSKLGQVQNVIEAMLGIVVGCAFFGAVFASPLWLFEWVSGWNLKPAVIVAFGGGVTFAVWLTFSGVRSGPPNGKVCWECEYDLTGNSSGTCPECGWKIPPNFFEDETTPVPPSHRYD
jgi:hypothetical protein